MLLIHGASLWSDTSDNFVATPTITADSTTFVSAPEPERVQNYKDLVSKPLVYPRWEHTLWQLPVSEQWI